MDLTNVEIKARCSAPQKIHRRLKALDAELKGTDHQIDTYFKAKQGRLKLREGTIEKNLIYYRRRNAKQPKKSDINLVPFNETSAIKNLLLNALEVEIIVEKRRAIYFIDNVKFHIDRVTELGNFVEIEAIDNGMLTEEKLDKQCRNFMQELGIKSSNLIAKSYADLIKQKAGAA
jgi:predicted adenylyl cyclase CyaB